MKIINVGGTDRIIRMTAGVIILVLGYIFQTWWGLIGLLPLLTGTFRSCPAYIPMKFSSFRKKKKE